MAFVII